MTEQSLGFASDELAALADRGLHQEALELAEASPGSFDADDLYLAARWANGEASPHNSLRWLDLARQAYALEGKELSSLRTELGRINVLDDLARTNEAIAVAERLQASLDEVDPAALDRNEAELLAWLRAAAAENLGASLGLAGRHAQAVRAHELAQARYVECGSEIDVARARANLGVDLIHVGSEPERALPLLQTARAVFSTAGEQLNVDRCLMYEGRALALMGHYGTALDRVAAAGPGLSAATGQTTTGPSVGPDSLRSSLMRAEVCLTLNMFPEVLELCAELAPEFDRRGMRRDLAVCRRVQADALLGQGRTGAALTWAHDCVDRFDALEFPVEAAAARITLARCLGPERGLVEIGRSWPVLAEAGESRRLVDASLVGADLAPDATLRRVHLNRAVDAGALDHPETRWRTLWHQSQSESSPEERVALLEQALETIGHIHDDLGADRLRAPFMVNRRDPLESRIAAHLAAGEHGHAYELSVDYRARSLRGDAPSSTRLTAPATHTTLLYQTIGERLLCFVARAGASTADVELVDCGDVMADVRRLVAELDAQWRHVAYPALRTHMGALIDATNDVLEQLHQAVFAPVEQHVGTEPLLVVPAGGLSSVPFSALYDGQQYSIERRALTMSAGVAEPSTSSRRNTRRTLAVGIPDEFAPLVRTEACQIAEASNGQLLLGDEAQAETVRAAIVDVDIVHLATHSMFRSDNPWLSWIKFADRKVSAAEFATWDLWGKTIVLAACSSGRQSSLGQDEFLGLPRAAFVAGATNVVVNQWAVDDGASVALMSQFHTNLTRSVPSEALRQAQQATRSDQPHPYFWAGPVVSSNPQPNR